MESKRPCSRHRTPIMHQWALVRVSTYILLQWERLAKDRSPQNYRLKFTLPPCYLPIPGKAAAL
jgi:hypothetical protein